MTPAEYRQEYLKRFGEKIKQYEKYPDFSVFDLVFRKRFTQRFT